MLASLGLFIFDPSTALYEQMGRRYGWNHARSDRFGALPAAQFTGPQNDTLSIMGTLVPEICGKFSVIQTLVDMGNTGDAYPFSLGDGTVLGFFTIENLDTNMRNIIDNGYARTIDFTLDLERVADEDAQ